MKQFGLFQFDSVNGEYRVFFGNRCFVRFASKRHLREFLAETNRYLTAAMVELSEIYCQLFTHSRQTWFILMNFKSGTRVNNIDIDRELQKLTFEIMDQFNRVGNTFHGSSGAWAFIHLNKICTMLDSMLTLLIQVNKKRNNTLIYHSLQVQQKRLKVLATELLYYPKETPPNSLGIIDGKAG